MAKTVKEKSRGYSLNTKILSIIRKVDTLPEGWKTEQEPVGWTEFDMQSGCLELEPVGWRVIHCQILIF